MGSKSQRKGAADERELAQILRDSERMGDGLPVLFHRRNRKPWLVTMRLEDWMRMYQK